MKERVMHIFIAAGLVYLVGISGIAQVADLEQKKLERETEMAQLFDILRRMKTPSMPVPIEIENEPNLAIRMEYFKKRQLEFKKITAKFDKAIADLAAMGDEVIDTIVDEILSNKSSLFTHRATRVLKEIGTPKAQRVLLDMALGQGKFRTSDSWAARNYLKTVKNKEDARKLLFSKNPDVLGVTLRALPGVTIDDELLKRLEELLQSEQYHPIINACVRWDAAGVISADPSEAYAEEKVSAVIKSLETVEQLPKTNEKFQSDRLGTLADNTYYHLINALAKMKGADEYLREATDLVAEKARMCVVIARALRGDASVKNQLYSILTDTNMTTMTKMRYLAASAFEQVGTVDDLPFLRKLAKTDPLEVVDFYGPLFEMVQGEYVNTGERMAPVREKSDPAWSTARRWYPVRRTAWRAIKLIEEKSKAQSY